MNKILITGGSGFIGTNLIDFYSEKCDILNIDIKAPRNKAHLPYWKNIDILDEQKTLDLFKAFQPDFVFHMGARTDLDGKTLKDTFL